MHLYVITLAAVFGLAHGYGSGAPGKTPDGKDGACIDMLPQHHTPEQKSAFPYSLTINNNKKAFRASEKVTITLSAPGINGIDDFQGFLVQARVGDNPVGKFSVGQNVKVIDCGTGKSNAATHSNASKKTSVTLQWTAPPNLSESVTFYATVAQNGGVFWVKQPTKTITIKK